MANGFHMKNALRASYVSLKKNEFLARMKTLVFHFHGQGFNCTEKSQSLSMESDRITVY